MSSTAGQFSFSRLPTELQWEIFVAAAKNYPECIPRIIRVAQRFRIWFEPELYRVIRSGEGRVVPPLYTSDSPTATLDFLSLGRFGTHVRHVLLQKRSSEEIKNVLLHTPNVTNLALWIIKGSCANLIPILESLPIRKLSFDPSYFFDNFAPDMSIPFDQPLFQNITHLEIINATSSWSKWKQLARLPQLTHLALAGMVNQPLIDQVLKECRKLQLFIMFYMNIGLLGGEVRLPQADLRVVLLKSVSDHLDHWEKGARGEEDFWITAEKRKQEAMEQAARAAKSEGMLVSEQGGSLF
ncbi:hypothetical protein CVT26_004235 [Gymnopilus dilepis]|uniref:F-box domain-containing protein n=1 Tax=Gymnopilus dilepis TaxID=231916 RepID=A0A409YMZ0_9AGAR|nr:hypothetical protein CVT26_004235 [Gymnopilus dilepis]